MARSYARAVAGRVVLATDTQERLYRALSPFYTASKRTMMKPCKVPVFFINALAVCFLSAAALSQSFAQEAEQKPAAKAAGQKARKGDKSDKAENPAQIELLETKVRFETNADSRKEVHALVKIHSELGVRQFAQLNFDFNRSFESVEIPLVHVTHASGGTSDILPSAITDRPNPAVVNAPAYQDVRVKSVRILGLQPGDTLEYRVVRAVSHHPLAPDFWLDHSFDRTGVVSHEIFELDLPASRRIQIRINPKTPAEPEEQSSDGGSPRRTYRWTEQKFGSSDQASPSDEPDVIITTYEHWGALGSPLGKLLEPPPEAEESVSARAQKLMRGMRNDETKLRALYDFVAQKIVTVDLPVGSTGFRTRPPGEILSSGYATAEDKFALLSALAGVAGMEANASFFGEARKISGLLPRPTPLLNCAILVHIFLPPVNLGHGLYEKCDHCGQDYWLFPFTEVAPFEVLPSTLRGKQAFVPRYMFDIRPFREAPLELPFSSTQSVHIDGTLADGGKLSAKVAYALRGDNELILREAFHHSPKEKWKELAQLLSITDGFRGQVSNATASDPYATKEPFTVEYELEQPKFVDWSKNTVRIPALLPQLGLPDAPAKPTPGTPTAPIELGTPLEVETHMTLHLPPDTTASAPAGISVERDYATYSSRYSASGSTITASRHIKFILREVPGARAADYNAFLRAVQSDEAQDFTIERSETSPSKTNPAAPNATAPPKNSSAKALNLLNFHNLLLFGGG